jgi:hypothetical protein
MGKAIILNRGAEKRKRWKQAKAPARVAVSGDLISARPPNRKRERQIAKLQKYALADAKADAARALAAAGVSAADIAHAMDIDAPPPATKAAPAKAKAAAAAR